MSIALDVGTERLRSLRYVAGKLIGRRALARYAALPDDSEHRRYLGQLGIPFAVCEERLVVAGDASLDCCRLFRAHAAPLLPHGYLPQDDPPARQLLGGLVEALIPPAHFSGEICALHVPGLRPPARLASEDLSRREASQELDLRRSYEMPAEIHQELEFFSRLLRLRGYQPIALSAGMALVLAELGSSGFSGLALSFGASECEATFAFSGVPLASCNLPRGGTDIDHKIAEICKIESVDAEGNRRPDVEGVGRWKVQRSGSLLEPTNEQEALLQQLHEEIVDDLLRRFERAAVVAPELCHLTRPQAVVVSGGPAAAVGFDDLLRGRLSQLNVGCTFQEPRFIRDSEFTIARGCLIAATVEAEALSMREAA